MTPAAKSAQRLRKRTHCVCVYFQRSYLGALSALRGGCSCQEDSSKGGEFRLDPASGEAPHIGFFAASRAQGNAVDRVQIRAHELATLAPSWARTSCLHMFIGNMIIIWVSAPESEKPDSSSGNQLLTTSLMTPSVSTLSPRLDLTPRHSQRMERRKKSHALV